MKMTYTDALDFATVVINSMEQTEQTITALNKIAALRATLIKRGERSDEAKEKASTKRKEQTAAKRAELCAQVVPILRDVMTTDMTAKEIFAAAKERLPQDFTVNKVQYILLNDMKGEVVKTEAKNKPNTYRLA